MKEFYATLDLGSNSFHMITAAYEYGEIKILDSTSDKVMLAEGLTKEKGITTSAMQRGIECIKRFQQRMQSIPTQNIRVVGTNTLRAAVNSKEFILKIQSILGDVGIDVISGIEEARLIFLGVNHSWSSLDQLSSHLVLDIGGGSTELIVGKPFHLKSADSLRMGCVSYRRFFPDGKISKLNFEEAVESASLEISNIAKRYQAKHWHNAIGSAGTFKALEKLCISLELTSEGITLDALRRLKKVLLAFPHIEAIELDGMKSLRQKTILPGLAIAFALFKQLKISHLHIARGGLREGVLYELIGRNAWEDVRKRSINAICKRYRVSKSSTKHYINIADCLCKNAGENIQTLLTPTNKRMLNWSLTCARIGLTINHSQYQNHSAYLLENSELSGFSLTERKLLAGLTLNHRRKLKLDFLDRVASFSEQYKNWLAVIFILRLSYLIGLNGKKNGCKSIIIDFKNGFEVALPASWITEHPLVYSALKSEVNFWEKSPIKMVIVDS